MVSAKLTDWIKVRPSRWRRDTNLKTMRGVVQRNGRLLPGLKKQLKDALWPEYKYKSAPRKTNYGHSPKTGLLIEKQVEDWCKKCKVKDGKYVGLARDPKRKEARVICGLLVARGWMLVDSQAPVAHGRIGTRLDWVFQGPQGKQFLVELKTGHNYGLRKAQGNLQRFPAFANHREQHALMQLTWTWGAIRKRGIELEPILMMVNKSAMDKYPTKATVRSIARKIQKDGSGNLAKPLPKRHRAIADELLSVFT